MEKQTPSFISWEKLRNIDLVDFLATAGHEPTRIRGQNYWYRSPMRQEKTPSFKVNRRLNRWHDFGTGKGGSIIDFCLEYYQLGIPEIVPLLSGQFDLPPRPIVQVASDESSPILIIQTKPLSSPTLTGYLKARGINVDLADTYVNEIRYTLYGKPFFALGFPNDAGGYEIRNPFFKGSSSPKAVTTITNGRDMLSVFEGFFDFLSYLTLRTEMGWPDTDYLILNSLSFVERSKETVRSYSHVSLYLDQDAAGRKATLELQKTRSSIQDRSTLYQDFQDLNEFLVKKQPPVKKSRKIRR